MNEEEDADNNNQSAPSSQRPIKRSEQSNIPSSGASAGNKNSTPCKFLLTKRGCAYGSECKFSHHHSREQEPSAKDAAVKSRGRASRPRVCRLYLSSSGSGCSYGDKCRYRHSARREAVREEIGGGGSSEEEEEEEEETVRGRVEVGGGGRGGEEEGMTSEDPVVLSLASFPGLGSTGEYICPHYIASGMMIYTPQLLQMVYIVCVCVPVPLLTCSSLHTVKSHHTSTPPAAQHPPPPPSPLTHSHSPSSHTKKHAPTELSLGSFMTTPTAGATKPHPPVPRPHRSRKKTMEELRQAELEQVETRFQGSHCLVEKGRERSVYRLTFAPTDPDWVSEA